uniref:rhomboid protease n=1 Tax=Lynceus sp. MCZ IZ 141354 TaxID=1930659 RepID=A0A9N6WYZ5_9CRUS|nr:EOG090X07NR [Lynceus sp. MCZ IZ 141354]
MWKAFLYSEKALLRLPQTSIRTPLRILENGLFKPNTSQAPYSKGIGFGGKGRGAIKFTPVEKEAEILVATPIRKGQSLTRPFLFTVAFSGTCFAGSAIWEYENIRNRANAFKHSASDWFDRQFSWKKKGDFRSDLNKWWSSLSEGQKLFYGVLFLNTLVFLAWKVPAWQKVMMEYFCSNPLSRAVCWPLLFSTFSHYAFIHLAANMYVLHSFSRGVERTMGKEQLSAFYLSGGVISAFASLAVKVLTNKPGSSLGASGAIMGILGYFCTVHSNSQLGIAFIPNFTFSADTGIKAIIFFDALGLVLGWKLFDHAAHLGGALFGIAWAYYGENLVWGNRGIIMKKWHQLRGDIK